MNNRRIVVHNLVEFYGQIVVVQDAFNAVDDISLNEKMRNAFNDDEEQ